MGFASVVMAWAVPSQSSDTTLTFWGINCSVVEPHFGINCTVPAGFGATLSWQLCIDGVNSTSPLSSYAAPVIASTTATSLSLPYARPNSAQFIGSLFSRLLGVPGSPGLWVVAPLPSQAPTSAT